MNESKFLLVVVEGEQLEAANAVNYLSSLDAFSLGKWVFLVLTTQMQDLRAELERRVAGHCYFFAAPLAHPITLNSFPHIPSTAFRDWFYEPPNVRLSTKGI